MGQSHFHKPTTQMLDAASIGLSGLCLAHCLILPVLAAGLPVFGQFSESELIHQVLVLIAAPLSVWAFWRSGGWRDYRISGFGGLGIFLLGIAAFYPPLLPYEAPLSIVGALMLAAAHLINATRKKALL
ncbi:MerC domain-containing protein [Asticcacaulis sp. SL142]|uniref:MerC domain-containing protein n=1 Tax=Asticcacaulis sp. SL142 TaxID=2995155 RepID=UPI00226CE287|nr:MerC domain-containing protein [Asticcacaulis sp. SL142]WAC46900.1 MerC domain-containing protein [Asticcacaulis sp. SL142]